MWGAKPRTVARGRGQGVAMVMIFTLLYLAPPGGPWGGRAALLLGFTADCAGAAIRVTLAAINHCLLMRA
ncbi:hypothetical protein MASR1M59_26370 [Melaminivora sp.]